MVSRHSRRVVVTGIGVINPLGNDVETVWNQLKQGRSGVGYTSIFDASRFPTKIAAEIKNWDITDTGEPAELWKFRGRHTKFAAGAAKQAMESSGVLDSIKDPRRFGVYMGSGEGNQDFMSFATMMAAGLDMPVGHMAAMFNAQGPNANCLTACAASSQAIGEATEIIRRGEADVMLSGGTHSMIHPFGVTGFNLLTALSTNNEDPAGASRPFDRLRDGFVLGEGGAMVVLEEYEHARKRGAHIFGEILGYGSTADAYRITDIHPEGRGAIACMRMAIKDAGLNPSDINYVNAHGTSTTVNDRVETRSCKEVFGADAMKVPVSSTKSMMGHLIAAAGATEMIVCLMAIRDNVLPPTINYENPDPECDLDYIPNEAREAECKYALNNSFGFGGQNITLVVGECQ
jgi:3-oxoacyl-[acyl-carrier-protein] synthase II